MQETEVSWIRKIPWRGAWEPTPVFLPGESHGQRSLASYSPWGLKESHMTERLSMHILRDGNFDWDNRGQHLLSGKRLWNLHTEREQADWHWMSGSFLFIGDAALLWSQRTEAAPEDWVQIPVLSSCVTLGKPFNHLYKIRDHTI